MIGPVRAVHLALVVLLAAGTIGASGAPPEPPGRPCKYDDGPSVVFASSTCPDSQVCMPDRRPDALATGICLYPCRTSDDCPLADANAAGCGTVDAAPLRCISGGCALQ
jgi:hypothetical protein